MVEEGYTLEEAKDRAREALRVFGGRGYAVRRYFPRIDITEGYHVLRLDKLDAGGYSFYKDRIVWCIVKGA